MYNLSVSILVCCYYLTVIFLNAQVLWKYIMFQYCNVFIAVLYNGNCVARKGLLSSFHHRQKTVVLSVNTDDLVIQFAWVSIVRRYKPWHF